MKLISGAKMQVLIIIVAVCAISSVQATVSTKHIKDLRVFATFGGGFKSENLHPKWPKKVTKYANQLAKKYLARFKRVKKINDYGTLPNVNIPGIKLLQPIYLKRLKIAGLEKARMNDIKWNLEYNRVKLNTFVPTLSISVNITNIVMQIPNQPKPTKTSIGANFVMKNVDLLIYFRYNIECSSGSLTIDRAELNLKAKKALIELDIESNVDETMSAIATVLNNPLEEVMGAILAMHMKELNEKRLSEVDATRVSSSIISQLPPSMKSYEKYFIPHRVTQ